MSVYRTVADWLQDVPTKMYAVSVQEILDLKTNKSLNYEKCCKLYRFYILTNMNSIQIVMPNMYMSTSL